MNSIDTIARHVIQTRFEDLPEDAVAAPCRFILDTLGVGILGSSGPWVEELIDAQGGSPSTGVARVFARSVTLSAPAAALCNAYQMHNSEFDCVHEGAVVHAVTCPLAVTLAEVDRLKLDTGRAVTGQQLIRAIALGVDVACHLGVASTPGLKFFRPGTCGAFGATAALAVLRGFDSDRLVSAFGIVHAQLCGTMQAHTEGSPLLGMQMGFNARNAMLACDLAERGVPGPRDVLEGPFGYFMLFESGYDLASVLPQLGQQWRITEMAHKPFPSGRATHGIVDACMTLRRTGDISPDGISRVIARVPPLIHHLVGRPCLPDMDINYARLCARFAAARILIAGDLVTDDFTDRGRSDSDSLALASRVEIIVDDNPDPNALTPVTVNIEMDDGAQHEISVDTVYGHPNNPMTRQDWLKKFRSNWQHAAVALGEDAREHVITQVENLPTVVDTAQIIDDLVL